MARAVSRRLTVCNRKCDQPSPLFALAAIFFLAGHLVLVRRLCSSESKLAPVSYQEKVNSEQEDAKSQTDKSVLNEQL